MSASMQTAMPRAQIQALFSRAVITTFSETGTYEFCLR
jgi:hypothetical protein